MKNKKKSKKKAVADTAHLYEGRLDVTRSGMGFVIIEGRDQDILVRPADFHTALHGDTVRVRVVSAGGRSGRAQGEVTEVVERKQLEFLGRIEISQSFAFFIADSDKPMPDIYVPLSKLNGATNNDKVIVKIVEWEKNKKPQGEVVQVMDKSDENDQAMKELLLENGFPIFFPENVLEESERLPDLIPGAEIAKRRDMRSVLTFTIDPVDAKDFDDAISIRHLDKGELEIGIHIADVSYYVEPETALDKEAYTRATSVYLPDRVNPMLPERISNELCSLRPHEDKLTFSAIFRMTPKGDVKASWLGRTVIHSDHRFTYEEVQEIIDQQTGLYQPEIGLLNDIAQRLRKHRFRKGAINFSSAEVRFKLDEKGKPIGIVVKESKESHQLVEEFMLLANRNVAEAVGKIKVNKKPLPFPYRVHDTPDKEKLLPFVEFAKKYGHVFDIQSPQAIARSFNQMLQDVQGRPEQHVLEQLGIRTMAKAIYTTENIGHYGLGFEHYCHFTSPIRRYPDVLVHRVLQEVLDGKIEPDKKMEAKCKQSSERERAAMESERAAGKYKQVEYMQNFLGDEFEGVISGVASFGFWVETVEHKCEGLVSINSLLEYDDFRHIESDYALVGRRSGRQFRMGDKVTIKVVAANLTKRQLDYEWVITSAEKEAVRGGLEIAAGDGQEGHAAKRKTARRKPGAGKPATKHGRKKKK
ncbi:ribonuclease R [Puia dinghuensis]|uniref:Ribonuclease R n=1 Tax=Puia dinghuensis TaxID=1792502 RepID=A0A8J2U6T6_9BACT|nr:ribonuclease R [Puia dinghuensis]GGA82654.1 ribonuclease R [Puia dinghuensis]